MFKAIEEDANFAQAYAVWRTPIPCSLPVMVGFHRMKTSARVEASIKIYITLDPDSAEAMPRVARRSHQRVFDEAERAFENAIFRSAVQTIISMDVIVWRRGKFENRTVWWGAYKVNP
jgi:hypothetical protein